MGQRLPGNDLGYRRYLPGGPFCIAYVQAWTLESGKGEDQPFKTLYFVSLRLVFLSFFSLRLSLYVVVQIPCISGISLHFVSLHVDMISLDGSVCGPMQRMHGRLLFQGCLSTPGPFAMQVLQGVDRILSCNLGVDSPIAWFASSVPCTYNCSCNSKTCNYDSAQKNLPALWHSPNCMAPIKSLNFQIFFIKRNLQIFSKCLDRIFACITCMQRLCVSETCGLKVPLLCSAHARVCSCMPGVCVCVHKHLGSRLSSASLLAGLFCLVFFLLFSASP